ncbi:MAG: hypothetical protein PHW52_01190 [Candidatus Pacebacteria bacterium]|nr:hypothetical protein [Candidatus Paceibacterota bacterium]
MQYKKEITFVVVAILVIICIANYIIQNQSRLEGGKLETQNIDVNKGETVKKSQDIHDTYTGVFMSGKGFQDNKVLKIDNSGTVAFEIYKEGGKTVQFGSWVLNTQKELVVSILGEEGKGEFQNPITFVFSYNDKNVLAANTFDQALYKQKDLNFTKLSEKEVSELVKGEQDFDRAKEAEMNNNVKETPKSPE